MHDTSHLDRRKEVVLFDSENPRSLANLLPPPFVKQMKIAWDSEDRKLFGLTEKELRKTLIRLHAEPTLTDDQIRMQFWFEFDRVQAESDRFPRMNMAHVMGRLISKEVFYSFHITDHRKMVWILCPPLNYLQHIEECLLLSTEKVRAILDSIEIVRVGDGVNAITEKNMQMLFRINRDLHARYCALSGLPYYNIENVPGGGGGTRRMKANQEAVEGAASSPSIIDRLAEKKREIEELKQRQAESMSIGSVAPSEVTAEDDE